MATLRNFFLPSPPSTNPSSSILSLPFVPPKFVFLRSRSRTGASTTTCVSAANNNNNGSSAAVVDEFWRWASERGASCPLLKPVLVAEGLGLVAQRDIPRNEVVLEVPKTGLWINTDTVASSDIGGLCSGLKPWVAIALFLLREKAMGQASPWSPYLGILPQQTNSPIFCAGQRRSSPRYKINHNENIASEDSSWEIKGKGLFSRELIFSLRTQVSVKGGEQVYIRYDIGKSNAELALDYGFIESRSDREAYTLTIQIPESDPFHGDKLEIAESNGLGETAYFDILLDCPLPPSMLPYLRLVALGGTDAFLLESIFRNSVWSHLELPVSHANEEMICHVVRNACKAAFSAYGTTIEEDEKLMERGDLDPRVEIAVGIRAGEKKVLQHIDAIFMAREVELDGLEYYQERRLRDLGLVGEQGEIIFWESK